MNCKFWVFRCIDEIDTCRKFKEGHANVLNEYNVDTFMQEEDSWMKNPDTFCIVAETVFDNKIVGGLRLQMSDNKTKLPIENSLGSSSSIDLDIQHLKKNGDVAEICAVWHLRRVAGNGISVLLLRAALAICSQLSIKTLLSLCSDNTLQMFQSMGFTELDSLKGPSKFAYPSEKHMATLIGIDDLINLRNSDDETKSRILSLREFPTQTYLENEEELKVTYNLII